jgi:hypothetical protein
MRQRLWISEPSRARPEPSRAEPSRAEPSRAEAEPSVHSSHLSHLTQQKVTRRDDSAYCHHWMLTLSHHVRHVTVAAESKKIEHGPAIQSGLMCCAREHEQGTEIKHSVPMTSFSYQLALVH